VLDGVYRRTDGEPVFVQADSPTDQQLQALLHKIITRLMKLLTRRGVLVEQEEEGGGSSYLADAEADSDDARALRPLQAAACTYRIAFGPRAGQKVCTVQGAMPRDSSRDQDLCADPLGPETCRLKILFTISQSVLALDFSPAMLAKARRTASAAHVHFVQSDLLQP